MPSVAFSTFGRMALDVMTAVASESLAIKPI
jgi:hypothetical protein